MKQVILFLFISAFFFSCNEKDDISKNNKFPIVYVSTLDGKIYNYFGDNNLSTGVNVVDTIKSWADHNAQFIIKVEDEFYPGIERILFSVVDFYGEDGYVYDTVPLFNADPNSDVHYDFSNTDTILYIECKNSLYFLFKLEVKDSYGLITSAHFGVNVIENIIPKAIFTAWNSRGLDPHEITIDASASRDGQEKWGGAIMLYEYYLNGELLTQTDDPIIKYIVPEAGNYKIDVKVRDNEDLWSIYDANYQSVYVTVND